MMRMQFYQDNKHYYNQQITPFSYPSELELLKIFPEAKDILNDKINEWNRIKGKIFCKEVLPTLERLSLIKDEFSSWFWKATYKQCFLPERYKQAIDNLDRLKRLKLIATKPQYLSKVENRERNKVTAKQFPIISLYSFGKLRKVGERYQTLCLFHAEDTPSFVIYPDNSFYCFGCQAHGDAIDFVRLLKDCSFSEAVESLMGEAQ